MIQGKAGRLLCKSLGAFVAIRLFDLEIKSEGLLRLGKYIVWSVNCRTICLWNLSKNLEFTGNEQGIYQDTNNYVTIIMHL